MILKTFIAKCFDNDTKIKFEVYRADGTGEKELLIDFITTHKDDTCEKISGILTSKNEAKKLKSVLNTFIFDNNRRKQ